MDEYTETRKSVRSDEEKKTLTVRVNRIVGQMNGIKRMVEEDRYCGEVLIQLAAIEKAVKSLSCVILEEHMHSCLKDNTKDVSDIDEIVELFRKFQ